MSRIEQVCERINDTFVVKCVEQIQPETILGLEVSDLISAIIAFFSVLAASFAGYAAWKANKLSESEAKANREHASFSVRPNVESSVVLNSGSNTGGIKKESFNLELCNKGLGPALIKDSYLKVNDNLIFEMKDGKSEFQIKDYREEIIKEFGYLEGLEMKLNVLNVRTTLMAGEKLNILYVSTPNIIDEDIMSLYKKIDFYIKYYDVYGQEQGKVTS